MNGQPIAAHWRVLSRGELVRGSTQALYYRATLSLVTGTAYCQTWISWNGVNGTGLNLTYPHYCHTLCWTKHKVTWNIMHPQRVYRNVSWQAHRKQLFSGGIACHEKFGLGPNLPVAKAVQMQKKIFTFIFQLSGLALVAPLCFALHC